MGSFINRLNNKGQVDMKLKTVFREKRLRLSLGSLGQHSLIYFFSWMISCFMKMTAMCLLTS